MSNIVEDVSKLTTIPEKTLTQLLDKFIYCIVDAVNESTLQNRDTTDVDVYFGVLTIKHEVIDNNHVVKCRFTPSQKLSKQLADLFEKKLNSLNAVLEQSLADKIIHTYKDLV